MKQSIALHSLKTSLGIAICFFHYNAQAEEANEAKTLIAEQQRAMQLLSGFDGTWRGSALTTLSGGRKLALTQTERFGNMLDQSIKVIEGRGYADDGTLLFNAFGVMSYEPSTGSYHFHSNAQGRGADLPIEIFRDRFVWRLELGSVTLRYTATVENGVWSEIGERLVNGQPPVRIHEMTLTRIGNTDWPAAGGVPPR